MDCKLLAVTEAIELVTGQKVTYATAWRWREKGCRGVKLRCTRLGGKVCCTVEDVRRFIAESNAPSQALLEPSK